MTLITEFASQLFQFMALKYDIIATNIPHEENIPVEDQDWSASDEFTVDIGQAVLMLSYSYRTSFRKQFNVLSDSLSSSKTKAKLYQLVFAQVTYKSHSPLKILVICAFISEMYLFLLYKSRSTSTIKDYLQPSTECFNCVYRAVLSQIDDPILKWRDVKRFGSLLASGYGLLQPVMETEHPFERTQPFLRSVQSLVEPAAETVREEEAAYEQAMKNQKFPRRTRQINEQLYRNLRAQSHHFFPTATRSVQISRGTGGKTPNTDATLAASSSLSLNSGSEVGKKSLTIQPKVEPSASNIDKSAAKGEATDLIRGKVDQTASNIPVPEEGKVGPSKKAQSKRKNRAKAKLAAKKLADDTSTIKEVSEANQPTPENPSAVNLRLLPGDLLNLTVKDSRPDNEGKPEESGKESLV